MYNTKTSSSLNNTDFDELESLLKIYGIILEIIKGYDESVTIALYIIKLNVFKTKLKRTFEINNIENCYTYFKINLKTFLLFSVQKK